MTPSLPLLTLTLLSLSLALALALATPSLVLTLLALLPRTMASNSLTLLLNLSFSLFASSSSCLWSRTSSYLGVVGISGPPPAAIALALGVRAAADGVEAVGSMAVRLGGRCDADTELELRCLLLLWAGWLGPASEERSRRPAVWGLVELEEMLVVLATEELWARRAESSRVRRLTLVLYVSQILRDC